MYVLGFLVNAPLQRLAAVNVGALEVEMSVPAPRLLLYAIQPNSRALAFAACHARVRS